MTPFLKQELYMTAGYGNIVCAAQTPWPLVRKRTIPTERPQLVDEI
jgi:hypothetical protein